MKIGRVEIGGNLHYVVEREGAIAVVDALVPAEGWRAVLAAWPEYAPKLASAPVTPLPAGKLRWLVPLADPPKFLLLAGNFRAHVVESGFAPLPDGVLTPQFFIKPTTTLIGAEDAIPLVKANVALDYEAELGVIVGKRLARGASSAQARDAVWGYTVINDISERKLNEGLEGRHKRSNDDFYDWLVGKWFDGSAPIGPWLVSKDEIARVEDLEIVARLNGEVVQQAPCSAMVHSIAEAIVYISQVLTLEPGDILSMGTPSGVGMARGRLLQDGDVIECEIAGLGKISNPVRA
jgi:2-keto-4-pentenoate hydratase/2-oxohepta-3-ene-1,7-dioic acid hydratase in catechol pathway